MSWFTETIRDPLVNNFVSEQMPAPASPVSTGMASPSPLVGASRMSPLFIMGVLAVVAFLIFRRGLK